jgi:hAT family C-terminal dimerisation region
MASSVSSERAFLSAGITISKHRNQLKGIIVEALQCLKCLYKNDLIFHEVITALKEKLYMEKEELLDSAMDVYVEKDEEFSWDSILDDEDNEDNKDTDL